MYTQYAVMHTQLAIMHAQLAIMDPICYHECTTCHHACTNAIMHARSVRSAGPKITLRFLCLFVCASAQLHHVHCCHATLL